MNFSDVRVRWAAIGAAVAVTLGAGGLVGVSAANEAESTLVPVSPVRVLDSRSGDRVGDLADGDSNTLQVTGTITTASGRSVQVVPAGASAIVGNLTMVDTEANDYGGFATIYPCGDRPDASNVNFRSGETVANSVAVPLSSTGSVCIFVYGTAHVLLDVSGYYTSAGLTALAADPLAGVDCDEAEVLVKLDGDWSCAQAPNYEVIEDANGARFTTYQAIATIDGANYTLGGPDGFVPPYLAPGYAGGVYHTTADCSDPGYMLTSEYVDVVNPDTVFSGETYTSGIWGDQAWGRIGTERGSTTLKYWHLDETSTKAEGDIVKVRDGDDCAALQNPLSWNGAVAYELVWSGESVTEQFEPPFSRVSSNPGDGGGLCFFSVPDDAESDVSALVC